MIVLGLTGSIAMGKSTVGAMMRTMHIPVHEADHAVHRFLSANRRAIPAIAAAFPLYEYPDLYDKRHKTLSRQKLGDLVFHNAAHRKTLEGILHPLVQEDQSEFIRAQQAKGITMVCLDIPLLFETGADRRVDYTLSVSAPYAIQKQRVLARPNMSEDKFHAILNRQMPDKEKAIRADYVIKTGLGRAYAMKSLKLALHDIQKKEGRLPPAQTERKSKKGESEPAFYETL